MEKTILKIRENENLQQLELPLLLDRLAKLLVTPYGNVHLESIKLLLEKPAIVRKLEEISEMCDLFQQGLAIPIGELPDIRPLLNRIQPQDAFLEPAEINQVKSNLRQFGEISRFIGEQSGNCPRLAVYGNRIHSHKALIQEIESAIDPHGEIREDASPELRQIRRQLFHAENEKKLALMRVIKRYSDFSQDDIVTLRDGRMVLGIQQHYVNQVNGIVHGTSGTGATVFIEPMETLRISNEIQNLKIDERKEIIRILQFLTGLLREIRNDIFYAIENYGGLDLIHAKARLSILMDGAAPNISETPVLKLMSARHPLLLLKMGHQNVVPCTLTLGEQFCSLVITGPNAGGKTVALKTTGLMVVMAQLGLHIPAHPDSTIPILDEVLVDIGDRQSLEQDLSTFSAHILRLQEILRSASTHTLILIDEIGSGTDPREGAALAIALLQELTERKTLTIATTHHGELKAFAYATAGVENGSMEFNLETLMPNYRLQVGVPGSSYAFEIARRYGFSESVLKRAAEITGPDKGQLENLILDLSEKLQKVEEDRRSLSIKLSETEGLQTLYQQEMERFKREKNELRRKAAEDAKQILDEANARIENAVAEIRASNAARQEIVQAHQEIAGIKSSVDKVLEETRPKLSGKSEKLHKGDIVWIENLREEGELLSEPAGRKKVWVLVGAVKMQLEPVGLKKVAGKKRASQPVFKKRGDVTDILRGGILPELDLRGMDSIEAVEATDRYLEQALGESWEEISIIHGKGTGVLRKEINKYLSRDKRVAEKRLGKWGEGDTGVTIVKLRKVN